MPAPATGAVGASLEMRRLPCSGYRRLMDPAHTLRVEREDGELLVVDGLALVRGLLLRPLRAARPPNGRDDLPQVRHVAASVVLRDVPHDEHSLRRIREAR